MSKELLQFVPFSSAVDAGFWYQLTKKKLDVFKLNDEPVEVFGFYSYNSSLTSLPPIANIDYSAFDNDMQIPSSSFPMKGVLFNTNTLEDFKVTDKKGLLQSVGQSIWQAITSGAALDNPLILQSLLCLTFADIKKYHYYYWIAFPAFNYPDSTICKRTYKFSDYFTLDEVSQFLKAYDSLPSSDRTLFLVFKENNAYSVFKLKEYEKLKKKEGKIMLGFTDPSRYEKHPGWPLRNALALAAYHWGKDQADWDVVCFREYIKDGKRFHEQSIVISIEMSMDTLPKECPEVVGWEKHKSKLGPRKVDMSSSMDPSKLADAAVDLNLKLMHWRLAPDLDLQIIKSTRCLLFGAGTLGCNVARCLLGWGVRKITFVDNSFVSFSNPVRQTLFEFEDCLQGGKPKAEAAAKALKRIFPGVESEGKSLSVPMPGHPASENLLDQVRTDVEKVEVLIENHDVIFLLTDTRESRWLPTLISASKEKIVVNAALGYDTFLVMRHGYRLQNKSCGDESVSTLEDGNDLGCYFCNDVVAPGNSLADRTLDQQCTVTRPGVSYMAAGLAVELAISILQHPKKALAPATTSDPSTLKSNTEFCTPLGIVPHQIRMYLDRFQNKLLSSKSFKQCTACSQIVLEEYKKHGFDFMLKVMNMPGYLEEITALDKLMENVNEDEVLCFSDDEDF